jgi:excinuclease ABC subunit C
VEGKRELFDGLRKDMETAEENLEKNLAPTRQFARGRGAPTTVKPTEDLAGPPRVMECFDISSVSSNHIVASMVRFTDGRPDNRNFRLYRIKTVEGQDDFASMAEVIRRRYSRILLENAAANPDADLSQEDPVEVQRLRDETHRFSNGYNALPYRRGMRESLLNERPGMSSNRKQRLLKKSGNVARIKAASAKEIATLPGISEKSSQILLDFLHRHR